MGERRVTRARELRRKMSLPEVLLWQRVRRSGLHIRRQHPTDRYVTDFFCAAANVVIEVDGELHELTTERDIERDRRLAREGLVTWRVSARSVSADPDGVAQGLVARLREKIGPE